MIASYREAFRVTASYFRKEGRGKRFDRERAAIPLERAITKYWEQGTEGMLTWLGMNNGWEKVQRQVQLRLAADSFAKTLSQEDRQLLVQLLQGYGYYNSVEEQVEAILRATSFDTFNEAATFALSQIGLKGADFELKNEAIRTKLVNRTEAGIFATRNNIDHTFETIIEHFYELGQNPYNSEFLADLKKDLSLARDYQAKRFALTETGIAAELAQVETYRRNGVTGKQWNITGANTRESHQELDGTVIAIRTMFNVGGSPGDHPLDPALPAEELVNCHCWLSPVVSDDFELDANNIWEGQ